MTALALNHNRNRVEPADHAEQITPLVRRMVAPNGSPFTFTGTCTYIVGTGKTAVIDPGPDNDGHLQALIRALDGESVEHIIITHTHRDHSPGARALQQATGAKIIGCAAHVPVENAPSGRLDASHDRDHIPDEEMRDGDVLSGAGFALEAIATPGHASNHLAFALRLFHSVAVSWPVAVLRPRQQFVERLHVIVHGPIRRGHNAG